MKFNLALVALTQAVLIDAESGESLLKNDVVKRSSLERYASRNVEDPIWSNSGEETHSVKEKLNKDKGHECDPNSSDVDLGFLSCGQGRFCARSETSSLGGVCSPRLKKARSLQGCPDDYYNKLGCDCSGYVQGVGGRVTDCLIYSNTCFDLLVGFSDATQVCLDAAYDFTFRYPLTAEASGICYFLNVPYSRNLCLNYPIDATGNRTGCEIIIDGVPCNSCTLTNCPITSGDDYFLFDCTNTVAGTSGSQCDGDFPLPIFNFVADQIDYSPTTPSPFDASPASLAPVPFSVVSPSASPTIFSVADTTAPPSSGTLSMPTTGTSVPTSMTFPTEATSSPTLDGMPTEVTTSPTMMGTPTLGTSTPTMNGMPTVGTSTPTTMGMPTIGSSAPTMTPASSRMPALSTAAPTSIITSSATSVSTGLLVLMLWAILL